MEMYWIPAIEKLPEKYCEDGNIFKQLDCRGKEYSFCPEHKTCGKYPQKAGINE